MRKAAGLFVLAVAATIVLAGTASAATIVVTPGNLQGWGFAEEGASGSGSFVNGPGTPPLGTGSARLTVNDTGRYLLGTYALAGTRLDAISALGYSTYRTAGNTALALALQMNFDRDVTDGITSWQGRLVYEPYFTHTVTSGIWQTWNPLDNAAGGNWWFSNSTLNPECPQSNPCTWAEVLSAVPNGGILASDGALLFRAGGPWTGGFDGNVDAFSITVNGSNTTVNFELSGPPQTGTILVDDDGAQCPTATFTSIQAAVTAAAPGAEVRVCAGTYAEQVTIPAGKNGLTVRAAEALKATIKAPAVMTDPGDIVRINGSTGVRLQGFKIAGPLPDSLFCSTLMRTGVRVDGGGSATISGNQITEVRSASPSLRGCQNGIAILVGRQSEGQTGNATIEGNQIETYQKGAIVVDGAGSIARIIGNRINGGGPDAQIARNGIQVSRGATGQVTANQISGNEYTGPAAGTGASGIILFQLSGNVRVEANQVRANDYGIVFFGSESGVIVRANQSQNNTEYGIAVFAGSSGNTIEVNQVRGNGTLDCLDQSTGSGTAGTANQWRLNSGGTSSPARICGFGGGLLSRTSQPAPIVPTLP